MPYSMVQLQYLEAYLIGGKVNLKLECGPMPNLMVALPNIGGALCSTPQSFWLTPTTRCRAVTLPRRKTR